MAKRKTNEGGTLSGLRIEDLADVVNAVLLRRLSNHNLVRKSVSPLQISLLGSAISTPFSGGAFESEVFWIVFSRRRLELEGRSFWRMELLLEGTVDDEEMPHAGRV